MFGAIRYDERQPERKNMEQIENAASPASDHAFVPRPFVQKNISGKCV